MGFAGLDLAAVKYSMADESSGEKDVEPMLDDRLRSPFLFKWAAVPGRVLEQFPGFLALQRASEHVGAPLPEPGTLPTATMPPFKILGCLAASPGDAAVAEALGACMWSPDHVMAGLFEDLCLDAGAAPLLVAALATHAARQATCEALVGALSRLAMCRNKELFEAGAVPALLGALEAFPGSAVLCTRAVSAIGCLGRGCLGKQRMIDEGAPAAVARVLQLHASGKEFKHLRELAREALVTFGCNDKGERVNWATF